MAEWIPCSERIPAPGVVVLTAIYGSDIIVREDGETLEQAVERSFSGPGSVSISFIGGDGLWCDGYYGGPEIIAPTYWMDFPEAPPNPKMKGVEA